MIDYARRLEGSTPQEQNDPVQLLLQPHAEQSALWMSFTRQRRPPPASN